MGKITPGKKVEDLSSEPKQRAKPLAPPKKRTLEEMQEDSLQIAEEVDEYEQDSSDEEDLRNTIGNVPVRWYDGYDHIGYDLAGNKIYKPERGDAIDNFLQKCEDPNYGCTVVDMSTGQDVILSNKDIELIKQYRKTRMITSEDLYAPFVDFFTCEKMKHPLRNIPPHKRSFIPSLNEKRQVSKLVHAIKMGWLKPREEQQREKTEAADWSHWDKLPEEETMKILRRRIEAPPRPKPHHYAAVVPPPEYLFTKEEEEEWLQQDPEDRKLPFIPRAYRSLLHLPSTPKVDFFNYLQDISLCPRQRRLKINVDPESLIPKLPEPKDLKPYPLRFNKAYKGHTDFVRTISLDSGAWLASGSDDCTLRVWHVRQGFCLRTVTFESKVKQVAWCPQRELHILAVVVENVVYLVDPKVDGHKQNDPWDIVKSYRAEMLEPEEDKPAPVQWRLATDEEHDTKGILCVVTHPKSVSRFIWHPMGKYFATVTADNTIFHKFNQFHSQKFSKLKQIQDLAFHHSKPFVFVATKTHLHVYNISTMARVKKLLTNCQWISRVALHPLGDNVLIGSYDNRVAWMDMEYSNKPYQMLRYHKKAVRCVAFHPSRPLFASASDDGKIVVAHGRVYEDYSKNPLIVAVKVLRGHTPKSNLTVLDCVFHTKEPWLFTAGADGNIHLYTEEI